MSEFVKIVFPLEVDDDGFPPISSETLNARRDDNGFILDNTPFFASGVALGDRISCVPADVASRSFRFDHVIESSSNKSLSIIFMDSSIKDVIFRYLRRKGCYCEYGTFGAGDALEMLAVSVPAACDYDIVRDYLDKCEAQGQLSYAELAV